MKINKNKIKFLTEKLIYSLIYYFFSFYFIFLMLKYNKKKVYVENSGVLHILYILYNFLCGLYINYVEMHHIHDIKQICVFFIINT